jgi:hypothetical protein
MFRAGSIDALMQEEYAGNDPERITTLVLPDGELQATLLVTQLKAVLIGYEAQLREERLDRLEMSLMPTLTAVK